MIRPGANGIALKVAADAAHSLRPCRLNGDEQQQNQ